MRSLQFLFVIAVTAIGLTSCATPQAPTDASEAAYPEPDRIGIQEDVQQMHGDILRQNY